MQRNQNRGRYRPPKEHVLAEAELIEQELIIFEEKAEEKYENVKWSIWETGKILGTLLEAPVPNRIHELEPIGHRPFSTDRSSFFNDRFTERLLAYPPQPPGKLIEGAKPECSKDLQDEKDEASDGRSSKNSDSSEATSSASEGVNSNSEADYDNASQRSTSSDVKRDTKEWKMTECYWFCVKQIFWSRFWIFLLQYVGANVYGEYWKTDGFNMTDRLTYPGESMFGDIFVRKFLAGLRRWDAQHFLFISDYHYVLEQSLAFFPGFPEVVNVARLGFQSYITIVYHIEVPPWVVTGVVSVLINLLFFHISGFCLFMVTLMITRSVKKGLLAVCAFAYNPASIFFTAVYTESMFFCLTMTGFCISLFAIRSTQKKARIFGSILGSTIFGLSLVVRSNGILNVIFVAWYTLGALLWDDAPKIEPANNLANWLVYQKNEQLRQTWAEKLRKIEHRRRFKRKVFVWTDPNFSRGNLIFTLFVVIVLCIFVYFLPFIFMTNATAHEFCHAPMEQKHMLRKLRRITRMPREWITIAEAMERTTWCRQPKWMGLIQSFYSEIQAKYWDVGFLQYWKVRKIPCFLMMIPAAILTILAIRRSLHHVFVRRKWLNIWVLLVRSDHMLPMVIHASILLFMAIFIINAEVFTRLMFSSSPFLYIYIADYLHDRTKGGNGPGNRLWQYENAPGILPFFVFKSVWDDGWRGKAFYAYFFLYFVVGTMAHAAWLPFT